MGHVYPVCGLCYPVEYVTISYGAKRPAKPVWGGWRTRRVRKKMRGASHPGWGEMVTALSRKQFSAWGQICPQPTHSVGRRGHTPAWFRPGRCGEGRHLPTGVKHKSEALCEGTAQYTVCLLPVKQESSRRDGREG